MNRKRPTKPDRSAEFASHTTMRTVSVMAMPASFTARVAVPKHVRHESEAWRRAVAALPCVLCGCEGQTQCAHRNEGKGMGLKTDDAMTAALCLTCHADIDQGPDLSRDDRRSRMDYAILLTISALVRAGNLRIATKGVV